MKEWQWSYSVWKKQSIPNIRSNKHAEISEARWIVGAQKRSPFVFDANFMCNTRKLSSKQSHKKLPCQRSTNTNPHPNIFPKKAPFYPSWRSSVRRWYAIATLRSITTLVSQNMFIMVRFLRFPLINDVYKNSSDPKMQPCGTPSLWALLISTALSIAFLHSRFCFMGFSTFLLVYRYENTKKCKPNYFEFHWTSFGLINAPATLRFLTILKHRRKNVIRDPISML